MEELTLALTRIELVADEIIDSKQQIVNLDLKRNKSREALNRLREISTSSSLGSDKHWVCIGDMFIRLNSNATRNLIQEDYYQTEKGVDKLHLDLKTKVAKLRELEGKPEISGLNLKPLTKREIDAFRTAFKLS